MYRETMQAIIIIIMRLVFGLNALFQKQETDKAKSTLNFLSPLKKAFLDMGSSHLNCHFVSDFFFLSF